jgi:hypothetical protein
MKIYVEAYKLGKHIGNYKLFWKLLRLELYDLVLEPHMLDCQYIIYIYIIIIFLIIQNGRVRKH